MNLDIVDVRAIFTEPEKWKDQNVTIVGWVRTNRDQKSFGFISLNDGSCFENIQVVYAADTIDNFADIAHIGSGAALIVKGTLILTPKAKQPFEIQAKEIKIEGGSPPEYPLQPKRHTPEFLRTIAHLRPRANLYNAVFRVRSEAAAAIHKFFLERGFVYVHSPIITASDAEGAGEMFHVTNFDLANVPCDESGNVDFSKDFFGKHTNLTVSGQLNAEAYAQAYRKVYTFGPTFRAEHSNTPRHAAEFWMIEPEIAFADLEDLMELAEDMLKFAIRHCLSTCSQEMAFFNKFVDKGLLERLERVVAANFERITYTEAVEILEPVNDRFDYKVSWGVDLQTEHERYLTEKHFSQPVFVTNYPQDIKAFYMRQNDGDDPARQTVAAMDCLVPGVGEIIGGSQREERYDRLLARMEDLGMAIEDYYWYLDLRKYGTTRHGGYGLGFERLIMYLTGVSNIRDVLPFPRTVGSAMF
ncbi:MAG TPA: asparagine--tRNA ligase [Clostridiaceae bacterium]|nr:asparagine--tRNA ligase [Clostridiaceae bacterium]